MMMNKENVSALAELISKVGFNNATAQLIRRICFKPLRFFITRSMQKDEGSVAVRFYFERQSVADAYALVYYDVTLCTAAPFVGTVSEIDVAALDKRMGEIDWKDVFLESSGTGIDGPPPLEIWADALAVADIVDTLDRLEQNGGAEFSFRLKRKHWQEAGYEGFTGQPLVKQRSPDITQRFFVQDPERVFTAEEAFRFLQNRCLEKQFQAKTKTETAAVPLGEQGKAAKARQTASKRKGRSAG